MTPVCLHTEFHPLNFQIGTSTGLSTAINRVAILIQQQRSILKLWVHTCVTGERGWGGGRSSERPSQTSNNAHFFPTHFPPRVASFLLHPGTSGSQVLWRESSYSVRFKTCRLGSLPVLSLACKLLQFLPVVSLLSFWSNLNSMDLGLTSLTEDFCCFILNGMNRTYF